MKGILLVLFAFVDMCSTSFSNMTFSIKVTRRLQSQSTKNGTAPQSSISGPSEFSRSDVYKDFFSLETDKSGNVQIVALFTWKTFAKKFQLAGNPEENDYEFVERFSTWKLIKHDRTILFNMTNVTLDLPVYVVKVENWREAGKSGECLNTFRDGEQAADAVVKPGFPGKKWWQTKLVMVSFRTNPNSDVSPT